MSTLVKFPIAKLLKEKGFNVPTLYFYLDGKLKYNHSIQPRNNNRDTGTCEVSTPTIADVVMWLYEKHGIWINTWSDSNLNSSIPTTIKWFYVINCDLVSSYNKEGKIDRLYNSPTEAYEAAIEYVLTNLI